eukprot:GHVS01056441.1.p1 GENE.GHVS01056441.1~~GHVS01056441.1.p1  ORF type:complete len:183 (+),score=26.06 GHVS01056441.1:87-635(+)
MMGGRCKNSRRPGVYVAIAVVVNVVILWCLFEFRSAPKGAGLFTSYALQAKQSGANRGEDSVDRARLAEREERLQISKGGIRGMDGGVNTPSEKVGAMAEKESLGFYTDMTDGEWIARKKKAEALRVVQYAKPPMRGQLIYPEWACTMSKRLGIMGAGGKWVCDPQRIPKGNCLVYSFAPEN